MTVVQEQMNQFSDTNMHQSHVVGPIPMSIDNQNHSFSDYQSQQLMSGPIPYPNNFSHYNTLPGFHLSLFGNLIFKQNLRTTTTATATTAATAAATAAAATTIFTTSGATNDQSCYAHEHGTINKYVK